MTISILYTDSGRHKCTFRLMYNTYLHYKIVGFNFILFRNSNRNQTEEMDFSKKQVFTICKMFENVQFFVHSLSKFAKSANMNRKKYGKKLCWLWRCIYYSRYLFTYFYSTPYGKAAMSDLALSALCNHWIEGVLE